MDMSMKLTNAVMKTRTFVEVFKFENMRDLTKSLFELHDVLNMKNQNYVKRPHPEVPQEEWEDPECEFWKSEEAYRRIGVLCASLQAKAPAGILWCMNPDCENSFGFMRSMEELKHWW